MLSANKAIKLLGLSRKEFSNDVKSGKIKQYDGCVLLDDLKEVYPDRFNECRYKTLLDIVKDQSATFKNVDIDKLEKQKLLREVKMLTAKITMLENEIRQLKEKQ
jgi:polyhydroxyalkanoate synthesis regulator phasin